MPLRDVTTWQDRLDKLAHRYGVPGASLAIHHGGELTAVATGVLNVRTGVRATTDSLFQIGSITKVYTATVVLRLLAEAGHTVDTRVAELLPGFRVADPEVTTRVTVRHLLAHTSGIDGDLFLDTGRGDDCVERYVDACADLRQNHPLGVTMSYCNAGYVVLGRIVERLSGRVWDEALREHLLEPMGLTHTVTLPEEVLRFRAAMGHVTPPGGVAKPAPAWGLMRSVGPAGAINATAGDVVAFARMHIAGGGAALAPEAAAEMVRPQVRLPDPWTLGRHQGLGWILYDQDGRSVYGHDGSTLGQYGFLKVVPDAKLAVCLLTNGGRADALAHDLFRDVLREGADLSEPDPPEPPARPPSLDPAEYLGRYERASVRIDVRAGDGGSGPALRHEITGALVEMVDEPVTDLALEPFAEMDGGAAFLCRFPDSPLWTAVVFYRLPTGERYMHMGARATPLLAQQ